MKKLTFKSWSDEIKNSKTQICLPLVSLGESFGNRVGEIRIDKKWKGLQMLDSFVIAPAYYIKKMRVENGVEIIEEAEIIEMNLIVDNQYISNKDIKKEENNGK